MLHLLVGVLHVGELKEKNKERKKMEEKKIKRREEELEEQVSNICWVE
jgi:hypothetical protein